MKTISISTDVFAAIWQVRLEGEETEDDILRRLLDVPTQATKIPPEMGGGRRGGFYDQRSKTHFFEGMEIYRTFKGTKIEARAERDRWFLPATGQSFFSLNKLSQAVTKGSENAWVSWKYRDPETAEEHFIDHWRQTKGQVESAP